MNIIDLQERLKDLPENALMQEMQTPTGTAPQFLVLSELKRRKRMRDEYQRQEAQGMQTVAEEAITAAGMPQEGIMGLAQGMAPRSAIAQDTGVNDMMRQDSVRAPQPEQPMMMAGGGIVRRMQDGGFSDRQQQGYLIFLEQMSLQDSPQSREMYTRMMERQAASPPAPEFYMRGMDEAPQGIASISADVSSFLPGGPDDGTRAMVGMPRADSRQTMMTAPPVLGAAPTADAIDFDASVFETAPAPPLHEGSGLEYGEMTPEELSILANGGDPIATEIINQQYNDSLTTQPLDDGNRAGQQPLDIVSTTGSRARRDGVGDNTYPSPWAFFQSLVTNPNARDDGPVRQGSNNSNNVVTEEEVVTADGAEIVPTEPAEREAARKLLERDADPVVSGGGGGG
jgi:hypothetical protein